VVSAVAIVLALDTTWLAARRMTRGASSTEDPTSDAGSLRVRQAAR
jgi:hypothetical protein